MNILGLSSLSEAALGALFVAVSIAMFVVNKFRVARVILVFTGICLTGLNGWLGHVAMSVTATVQGWFGSTTAGVFGITAATGVMILSALLTFKVVHDLHPRGGTPSRGSYWAAILLAVMVVTGTTGWQALNHVDTVVKQGVSTIQHS